MDHLPTADVDESFTRTTVAMVAVSASGDVDHVAAHGAVAGNAGYGGAGRQRAALAFAAGYVVVAVLVSRENRRLLRDLPVIERLDQYRYADSVEFLRQLEHEGLFTEDEIANEM